MFFIILYIFGGGAVLSLHCHGGCSPVVVQRQLQLCGGFSCCTAQALEHEGFCSCGSQALEHRLNSHGAQASLLHGMWDLP